jgi:hypothetical protein
MTSAQTNTLVAVAAGLALSMKPDEIKAMVAYVRSLAK